MSINVDLHKSFIDVVDLLYVLDSEIRLKILEVISQEKEYRLKDLLPHFECGISNLSQQVKILEEAGLVEKICLNDGTHSKMLVPIYDKICIKLREPRAE